MDSREDVSNKGVVVENDAHLAIFEPVQDVSPLACAALTGLFPFTLQFSNSHQQLDFLRQLLTTPSTGTAPITSSALNGAEVSSTPSLQPGILTNGLLEGSQHIPITSAPLQNSIHQPDDSIYTPEQSKFLKSLTTNVSGLSSVSEVSYVYAMSPCAISCPISDIEKRYQERLCQESLQPTGQKRLRVDSGSIDPVGLKIPAHDPDNRLSSRTTSEEFATELSTLNFTYKNAVVPSEQFVPIMPSESGPSVITFGSEMGTSTLTMPHVFGNGPSSSSTTTTTPRMNTPPSTFYHGSEPRSSTMIPLFGPSTSHMARESETSTATLLLSNTSNSSTKGHLETGTISGATRNTPSIEIIEHIQKPQVPVIQRLPPTVSKAQNQQATLPAQVGNASNVPNLLDQRSQHLARIRSQVPPQVCVFESFTAGQQATTSEYTIEMYDIGFRGEAEMVVENSDPHNMAQQIHRVTVDINSRGNEELGTFNLRIMNDYLELHKKRETRKIRFEMLTLICKDGNPNVFSIGFYQAENNNRMKIMVFTSETSQDITKTLSNKVLRASGNLRKYKIVGL